MDNLGKPAFAITSCSKCNWSVKVMVDPEEDVLKSKAKVAQIVADHLKSAHK